MSNAPVPQMPEDSSGDAEFVRAEREAAHRPPPPGWLTPGTAVVSAQHGTGTIKALLGNRIYIEYGSRLVSYPDWQQALARAQFVQATSAPPPALDLDARIAAGQPAANAAAIADPRFAAFARALAGSIYLLETLPGQAAQLEPMPANLPEPLRRALADLGIHRLYHHQREALDALRSGADLMLVTPTASGKTLCFNPAVFESLLLAPEPTALYLYPLKALLYDQLGKLTDIGASLELKIRALTGDTPAAERREIFSEAPPRILAASPDILHFFLYKIRDPQQGRLWRDFLARLRWVVIDEAHTYIGNFGAHLANLLRRLSLAVATVGGDPERLQFVLASATVGNPEQLAAGLTGRPTGGTRFRLISESGAAVGERTFTSLTPSASANPDAARIICEWLRQGISGLVFCNSRVAARGLLNLTRRLLRGDRHLAGQTQRVSLFYGSLKPERRRAITEALRDGKIQIVITTSALEAGLDLPSVDAVLLRGFPGSLMASRQRAGRCGRNGPGLVVYLPVAGNPLDAYYALHPRKLLTAPAEQVAFNAGYPSLLAAHLRCACCESRLPIADVEPLFGPAGARVAEGLLIRGELHEQGDRLVASGFPHRDVALRGEVQSSYRLIDSDSGETIEELSELFAFTEAHPQALYLCLDEDQQEAFYRVESLDCERREVIAFRLGSDPDYRTRAVQQIAVERTARLADPAIRATTIADGRARLILGWGRITTLITGFVLERILRENACANARCLHHRRPVAGPICPHCHLPARQTGVRSTVEETGFEAPYTLAYEAPLLSLELNPALSSAVCARAEAIRTRLNAAGIADPWEGDDLWVALHTAEHLLMQAVPLLLVTGAHDIDGATFSEHAQCQGAATIFFDSCPGGTGVAEALFDRFGDFARAAIDLASSCTCEAGCPTCLFRHGCAHWNVSLNRELGLYLLELLVGE